MNFLIGSYDSDEEAPPLQKPPELEPVAAVTPDAPSALCKVEEQLEHVEQDEFDDHDAFCECTECSTLMLRFMAKNLQTKGIRFKCKLCSSMLASKIEAGNHFKKAHVELQSFKQQKMPRLFQNGPSKEELAARARQKAFAKDRVLKRAREEDGDAAFGGWAKKEKAPPPPCEAPESEGVMQTEIFTAPPWEGQRPTDEDATEMDREVDKRVIQAQTLRFCKRNVLEVKRDVVRCKLCYKTLTSAQACEEHIRKDHEEDFKKEIRTWERFLFTTCKRQPPFGWVCKICQIFFASDGACWRHVGKEVYIRLEERHMGAWHEKEDRWGHAEDEECCGDGINSGGGLSYESVMAFHRAEAEEAAKEKLRKEAAAAAAQDQEEESSSSEDVKEGEVQHIEEF